MVRYRIAKIGIIDQNNGDALILPNRAGWGEYVAWRALGNRPDPMLVVPHVVTPAEQATLDELAARDAVIATLKADSAIQALRTRTPAQVDSWIDANVVDLASARAVLKILARVLALLARERI
jgi:hypothetical protein